MEIIKFEDYKGLSENLGNEILECMKSEEKTLICLASGDTPLGAFEYMVNELGDEDLSKYNFTFVGLDE